MRFREKQKEIDAYQVAAPLRTENGNVVAETGDWIAVVDRQQIVYTAEQFARLYGPIYTDNPALLTDSALLQR